MLEFFNSPQADGIGASFVSIFVRLFLAALSGLFIATVYRSSHGREKRVDNNAMFTTLVLLCIFIAMVSLVIGNSVAMAFSLVGALSIVRFRTVVDDTRDTAFVIFAVITGMAMGAGYFAVPMVGLPVASIVAIALHHWNPSSMGFKDGALSKEWMQLTLRVGIGKDPKAVIDRLKEKLLDSVLISTSTAKQGAALELVLRVQLRHETDPIDFVSSANLLDGVQAVELVSNN